MWNVVAGRSINLLMATMAFSLSMCGQDARPSRASEAADDTSSAKGVTSGTGPKHLVGGSGKYIGTVHGALPLGVHVIGGSVIADKFGRPSVFSFTHVQTPAGGMIWLDSADSGPGVDGPQVVLAELPIPPLASDERLFMASCDIRGSLDGSLVAIVVNEPQVSRFTKIRQAWRADARLRRFELVPLDGVSCEDPDRGPG